MKLLSALIFVAVAATGLAADWWENEVFYQIYPRSFADSNGDGVGDLQGVNNNLEHLKDAGISAMWLSPIFSSPMVDFGYDISDFRNIHSEFGTMDDFERLTARAKELGIKVILDFVPNHTSDKHAWFQKSAARTPGFEDFYVWNDGKIVNGTRQPPNNWLSNFGFAAWTFHEGRQQWYLHQFAPQQPDLNYRNEAVVKEMKDTMIFWLNKNVSGFRIDAVPFLFEEKDLRDEPRSYDATAQPTDYAYLLHPYTNNLDESYDMIYQWRALLDDYTRQTDNITRVMMTEAYADIKHQVRYYGDGRNHVGAHFTFNFLMITDLQETSNANDFMMTIYKWLSYMPIQYTPNWVLGNHDNHRVGSRYGEDRIDGLNMLLMMLPGVGVTYYGEEIGMLDGSITWEQTKDPQGLNAGPSRYELFSRDPERTPFQWDNSTNAGFSSAANTWLPVASTYTRINLAAQKQQPESHYKLYQQLLKLRKENTLRNGDLRVLALTNQILALSRTLNGEHTYIYVFNMGADADVVDLTFFGNVSEEMSVVLNSVGAQYKKRNVLKTNGFQIAGYEAYILKSESPLLSSI